MSKIGEVHKVNAHFKIVIHPPKGLSKKLLSAWIPRLGKEGWPLGRGG